MKLQKDKIPFTQVANEVLTSTTLSWKAKGIYAYLFSKPDGWDFSANRIKDEALDGRHAVLAALKELEEKGYLERRKQGNGRVEYHLKHSTQSQKTELRIGDPKSENRTVRKPHSAKTDTISNKEDPSNKEEESNNIAETSSAWVLEDKLKEMESKPNSYLDIIATFIREKPVAVENSKALSGVIARYSRIAKRMSGAYNNNQIFRAAKKIQEDNGRRERKGEEGVDYTLETIYKQLTK